MVDESEKPLIHDFGNGNRVGEIDFRVLFCRMSLSTSLVDEDEKKRGPDDRQEGSRRRFTCQVTPAPSE